MNERSSTSVGSMLVGFLLGAAIGAAAAMLYAPKSGKEMREELSGRLDELKDQFDHTVKQMTEVAKTRLAEAQSDLSRAVEASRVAAAERAAELRRQAGLE